MASRPSLIQCLKDGLSASGSIAVDKDNDAGIYNDAKLPYNVRVAPDVSPLAIAFVHTQQEISNVIACARSNNVPIAPRSGGHSYGAYSLGGALGGVDAPTKPRPGEPSVIVDLRGFRDISYDSALETVTVGSGAMLGELINSLGSNGRMTPTGTCPTVGVGGHALSGGFGLYSKQFGTLAEQITSMDVILADGTSAHVSQTENPDLFFALRGGGTAFAVAHQFTFKTYPAPPSVYYYELTLLPRALASDNSTAMRAANYFMAFQEYAQTAPSQMSLTWHVTPERGGSGWGTKVEVLGQYMGSEGEFNTALQGLKDTAGKYGENQLQTAIRPFNFLDAAHNTGGDWSQLNQRGPYNLNEHIHFYAKNFITTVDYSINTIFNHMRDLLSLSTIYNPDTGAEWFNLSPYYGGNSAIKGTTGAFAYPDMKIMAENYAKRTDGSSTVNVMDVVNKMVRSLGVPKASYPAYVDTEIPAGAFPQILYGDLYSRLQSIKSAFDVNNLFRQPQSVKAGSYQAVNYEYKRDKRSLRYNAPVRQTIHVVEDDSDVSAMGGAIDWPKPTKRIHAKSNQNDETAFGGLRYLLVAFAILGVWYAVRRRRSASSRVKGY